jgi:hypothetical protein
LLHEITSVAQLPSQPRRRWFQDEDFDLFVWQAEDGRLVRFQLAYDRRSAERVLTWDQERGYGHHAVDDGEGRGAMQPKASPVLVADGVFDAQAVADRFRAHSGGIDPAVVAFVEARLRACPR